MLTAKDPSEGRALLYVSFCPLFVPMMGGVGGACVGVKTPTTESRLQRTYCGHMAKCPLGNGHRGDSETFGAFLE